VSNLKLGAGVKNVFDKQYFTGSSDNNQGCRAVRRGHSLQTSLDF